MREKVGAEGAVVVVRVLVPDFIESFGSLGIDGGDFGKRSVRIIAGVNLTGTFAF